MDPKNFQSLVYGSKELLKVWYTDPYGPIELFKSKRIIVSIRLNLEEALKLLQAKER